MKNILILGAGLSCSSLIRYLLQNAEKEQWFVRIVDQDKAAIESKINGSKHAEALVFNALDPEERKPEIEKADIVISMLPARFHVDVAKDCIALKTNLITPSYVSPEMKALNEEAEKAGIVIMNEIGVDPGIDHMSAMRVIDDIRDAGGKMKIFESFTGGLVAPESDDNPWNYKFTWNPRNVVLAGQGGAAQFIQEGRYKYIPYTKLFRRTEIIDVENYGRFEGYANRNSLMYREIYGLQDIPTIYRGTLRRVGFSRAWDVFVQLGATDDSYTLEGSENMTNRDFINSFLPYNHSDSVELKLRHYMKIDLDDSLWDKLVWLGIFDDKKKIGIKNATPAQMMQKILEEKWALKPQDKDMIVMYHKFVYQLNGELREITSEMVNIGEDQTFTSMSNTVGLPVGICVKKILNGTIQMKGVLIPTHKEIYNPILKDLEEYGIEFKEKQIDPPRLYNEEETWK
ncbi:saccharopine dehydrogenase C-terminal domain-containing protein [Brumimicrobium aurantiacum]|uniref:Saccharopine dehydrogenase n=1 Tax=Brumimicrobium aurantiacum TaxID=1737063 RepID=A0A3E1EY04_9FLAO|nr:saccharopine dehydrogenase C-terminal domain-containing protein [Brumimicrobium aurantiacum]RFC54424.1 saccharopine dehydrogenase [Brumimicrobium aurantiacum]